MLPIGWQVTNGRLATAPYFTINAHSSDFIAFNWWIRKFALRQWRGLSWAEVLVWSIYICTRQIPTGIVIHKHIVSPMCAQHWPTCHCAPQKNHTDTWVSLMLIFHSHLDVPIIYHHLFKNWFDNRKFCILMRHQIGQNSTITKRTFDCTKGLI